MGTARQNDRALHEALNRPSANQAHIKQPPPVRMVNLDFGASRVVRQNESGKRDELWIGDARDPASDGDEVISVYLRLCAPNPLVAELVCGHVAAQLDLPCPEVFVLLIEPGTLPQSRFVDPQKRMLTVATRDLGGDSFTQLINRDSAYAKKLIASWKHLVPVVVLDEWMANPDRNLGNIIYTRQAMHIIDHAEAFGGSCRKLYPLAELTEDQFTNLLSDELSKLHSTARARKLALDKAAQWIEQTARKLDVESTVISTHIAQWHTPEQMGELIKFIQQRLSITHKLLCNRMGHPQLAIST